MSAQAHADHGAPSSFVRRWLYSTNHKDIGTMYLVFAILAAFIGGGLSIYMRMELMEPGVQYMADGHVWNVFTTAHGLIMVFFLLCVFLYRLTSDPLKRKLIANVMWLLHKSKTKFVFN